MSRKNNPVMPPWPRTDLRDRLDKCAYMCWVHGLMTRTEYDKAQRVLRYRYRKPEEAK